MPGPVSLTLRPAGEADLAAVDGLIERAIATWNLPERVRRLSLPAYRYDPVDLRTLTLLLAEAPDNTLVGLIAWEPADRKDTPQGRPALLVHGLYVEPTRHRLGIGNALLRRAEEAAARAGLAGLLVKAQRDAQGFFLSHGFELLPVAAAARDYPQRLWKPV